MADLRATLAAQRTAFTAELPVPLAVRKDRLKRVVALLKDGAEVERAEAGEQRAAIERGRAHGASATGFSRRDSR